jgi:preprotein translocase subunit SecG
MQLFLDIVFIITAVLIIILSLLQGGKAEGASASIMGGMRASNFVNLKERGPEKFLTNLTFGLSGLFFLLAIVVRLFAQA